MGAGGLEEEDAGGVSGGLSDDEGRWPPWLKPLLSASFFLQCKRHAHAHKSECNMYCLDCTGPALCSLCVAAHHREHRAIQIRRSSYHDVIRVSEIQKVLDITDVQTYVINSARVVFLNERPLSKPGKGVANVCEVCSRSLLNSFRFCSLGCKIIGCCSDQVIDKNYGGQSSTARRNNKKMHKTVLEMATDSEGESSCTVAANGSSSGLFAPSSPPPPAAGRVNYHHIHNRTSVRRRKGIPHRAPLGNLIMEW